MATRNFVPRATGEGGIGTLDKKWAYVYANTADVHTINAKNIIAETVSIDGGADVSVVFGKYLLGRNTAYAVGDIAYSTNLPSYLRLECVSAGTTGATEPSFASMSAGQYVTDGTAVFLVTDIRDGAHVGDIKMSPILRDGYVKTNGALLTSASTNYPRLVQFITDNPSLKAVDDTAWASNKALYVYDDTNDTLRVPDATGRVLQGGSAVESVEAGLPNIEGSFEGIRTYLPSSGNFGSGALYGTYNQGLTTASSGPNSYYNLRFDASRSNAIYGSSTTNQPPALTLIPQIKY